MSKLRYNKSKTYLLPLLSELIGFDKRFFSYLDNTYIYDDLGKYKNCIFILHDFSFKNPEFTNYENEITNNEYFIDLIDINDKVLYIFKFPEEYMHEYNNFKVGKYSNFKLDAKELILEYYERIYKHNINAINFLIKTNQILFRDKKLKLKLEKKLNVSLNNDSELDDIIKKDNETFNISKYINEENKNKKIKS